MSLVYIVSPRLMIVFLMLISFRLTMEVRRRSPRLANKTKSFTNDMPLRTTQSAGDSYDSKAKKEKKSTTQFHYEFGGIPGAFATMVALPIVIYFLYFSASKYDAISFLKVFG